MPHGRERQVKEKILQLTPHYKGYQMVFLYDGSGTDKKFFVHRLVGMHFLSKKEEHDVVNHKDLDKANNNLVNLEWATHAENIQHYWENRVADEVF